MVTVSLCNAANFDTILAVYEEDLIVLCQATLVDCNDDAPGCASFTSELQFMANVGTFYLVQVGAFSPGILGTGTLTITENGGGGGGLPNDECAGALDVFAGSLETFDTSTATDSATAFGCVTAGSDIWFRYFSPTDRDITVSLCNSSYDTTLEVYLADCSTLPSVLCNDDFCGLQSQGTFTPTASTDYLIRVGGFGGATGVGELVVLQDGPIGANYCMTTPRVSPV